MPFHEKGIQSDYLNHRSLLYNKFVDDNFEERQNCIHCPPVLQATPMEHNHANRAWCYLII